MDGERTPANRKLLYQYVTRTLYQFDFIAFVVFCMLGVLLVVVKDSDTPHSTCEEGRGAKGHGPFPRSPIATTRASTPQVLIPAPTTVAEAPMKYLHRNFC